VSLINPIRTERLILRRFVPEDLIHLSAMLGDPEVMKYYGPQAKSHTPEKWFSSVEAAHEKHGMSSLAVELKDTGVFIGQAGILFQDVEGTLEQEVAYMFKKDFWGKGYASEATRECMRYAYSNLNPRRFISLINPKNDPSINLAKRNGMEFERMIEKWGMPVTLYSITLERWKATVGSGSFS